MLHVHCVANAEAEFDFHVITWCHITHYTALLYFVIARQYSVCFDEPLEVDTEAIKVDLSPRQFRQCFTFLVLGSSHINHKSDI